MRLALFILIWILTVTANNTFAADVVITDVTIISSERNAPLHNANVVISDGVITEISVKPVAVKGAQVLDAKGLYLTPGLMDSHVHLRTMPGIIQSPRVPEHLKPLQETFVKNQPKAYLYYGVTELLDLNQISSNLASFNAQPYHPDVSFCGAIGVMDGYGTAGHSVKEALAWHSHILFDDEQGFNTPKGLNPAEHTPQALVKNIAKDGAKCVKVFFEDGFGLANHWKILTDKLVQDIRKEAQKHGLIVIGHANAIDMHDVALKNQVDAIAHGIWNWNELESQPGLPAGIENLVERTVAQKTIFQPTFNVMEGLAGVMADDVFDEAAYIKVVPSRLRSWYQTEEGKWFRRELLSEVPDLTQKQVEQIFIRKSEQNARVVKRLVELEHPLVLASDTPSSPTYAAQPGYSTHREIMQMYKAGVPLKQLFDAATLNNAKAFGMTETYGTVETGKKANLLLLSKNPLQDIEAYDAIEKVILRGEVIEREKLLAQ